MTFVSRRRHQPIPGFHYLSLLFLLAEIIYIPNVIYVKDRKMIMADMLAILPYNDLKPITINYKTIYNHLQ